MQNQKEHWNSIYSVKKPEEVSWTEEVPETSLQFIHAARLSKDAKIIDVGGGDSKLVDHLLAEGFQNITVLDISEKALERARQRLGEKAENVKWIVADAAHFKPVVQYDFWHDRAAFHFLTDEKDINNYIDSIRQGIKPNGFLVIGTFSEKGPEKCSGLPIKQYTETAMAKRLEKFFKKIKCITVDHLTPFNTIQNFIFCSFKKSEAA
jgi:ubiquinone/menaquinone biosynthesis C-methylase UbiE